VVEYVEIINSIAFVKQNRMLNRVKRSSVLACGELYPSCKEVRKLFTRTKLIRFE
jgi:hypothetical protein